jgi:protein-L-isoaspartate O-methyltransferase
MVQHGYCLSMLADHLKPGMSVLDVGSGSGYLTAVFALMVCVTLLTFSPLSHLWRQWEEIMNKENMSSHGNIKKSSVMLLLL